MKLIDAFYHERLGTVLIALTRRDGLPGSIGYDQQNYNNPEFTQQVCAALGKHWRGDEKRLN